MKVVALIHINSFIRENLTSKPMVVELRVGGQPLSVDEQVVGSSRNKFAEPPGTEICVRNAATAMAYHA